MYFTHNCCHCWKIGSLNTILIHPLTALHTCVVSIFLQKPNATDEWRVYIFNLKQFITLNFSRNYCKGQYNHKLDADWSSSGDNYIFYLWHTLICVIIMALIEFISLLLRVLLKTYLKHIKMQQFGYVLSI